GDDLGRDEVVDGHPVLAHEPAKPAAEGEAGDAGARDLAAGRGQAMDGGGGVELGPGHARLGPHGSGRRVDLDGAHRRQVDHQAALGDGLAGDVVAAAPDRHLAAGLPPETDGVDDVGRRGAAGDDRGVLVDHAVVDATGVVVTGV